MKFDSLQTQEEISRQTDFFDETDDEDNSKDLAVEPDQEETTTETTEETTIETTITSTESTTMFTRTETEPIESQTEKMEEEDDGTDDNDAILKKPNEIVDIEDSGSKESPIDALRTFSTKFQPDEREASKSKLSCS